LATDDLLPINLARAQRQAPSARGGARTTIGSEWRGSRESVGWHPCQWLSPRARTAIRPWTRTACARQRPCRVGRDY